MVSYLPNSLNSTPSKSRGKTSHISEMNPQPQQSQWAPRLDSGRQKSSTKNNGDLPVSKHKGRHELTIQTPNMRNRHNSFGQQSDELTDGDLTARLPQNRDGFTQNHLLYSTIRNSPIEPANIDLPNSRQYKQQIPLSIGMNSMQPQDYSNFRKPTVTIAKSKRRGNFNPNAFAKESNIKMDMSKWALLQGYDDEISAGCVDLTTQRTKPITQYRRKGKKGSIEPPNLSLFPESRVVALARRCSLNPSSTGILHNVNTCESQNVDQRKSALQSKLKSSKEQYPGSQQSNNLNFPSVKGLQTTTASGQQNNQKHSDFNSAFQKTAAETANRTAFSLISYDSRAETTTHQQEIMMYGKNPHTSNNQARKTFFNSSARDKYWKMNVNQDPNKTATRYYASKNKHQQAAAAVVDEFNQQKNQTASGLKQQSLQLSPNNNNPQQTQQQFKQSFMVQPLSQNKTTHQRNFLNKTISIRNNITRPSLPDAHSNSVDQQQRQCVDTANTALTSLLDGYPLSGLLDANLKNIPGQILNNKSPSRLYDPQNANVSQPSALSQDNSHIECYDQKQMPATLQLVDTFDHLRVDETQFSFVNEPQIKCMQGPPEKYDRVIEAHAPYYLASKAQILGQLPTSGNVSPLNHSKDSKKYQNQKQKQITHSAIDYCSHAEAVKRRENFLKFNSHLIAGADGGKDALNVDTKMNYNHLINDPSMTLPIHTIPNSNKQSAKVSPQQSFGVQNFTSLKKRSRNLDEVSSKYLKEGLTSGSINPFRTLEYDQFQRDKNFTQIGPSILKQKNENQLASNSSINCETINESQNNLNLPSSCATINQIDSKQNSLKKSLFTCKKIKMSPECKPHQNPKITIENKEQQKEKLPQQIEDALFFQLKFSRQLQKKLFTHKMTKPAMDEATKKYLKNMKPKKMRVNITQTSNKVSPDRSRAAGLYAFYNNSGQSDEFSRPELAQHTHYLITERVPQFIDKNGLCLTKLAEQNSVYPNQQSLTQTAFQSNINDVPVIPQATDETLPISYNPTSPSLATPEEEFIKEKTKFIKKKRDSSVQVDTDVRFSTLNVQKGSRQDESLERLGNVRDYMDSLNANEDMILNRQSINNSGKYPLP